MPFDLTLTFDNGPTPGVTEDVLAILADHEIKATFFVIGEKLSSAVGMRLMQQVHAAGHWIGNHTWTHSVPFGLREVPLSAVDEIAETQALIGPCAHPHKLFRPFGGGGNLDRRLLNRPAADYLQARRFTCVLWNAIPRDWDDPDGWVETALAQCRAQPWTLMVLHDLPTGAMRHLDHFITRAKGEGARLRQDHPPDCVPIVDGVVVRPIEEYTALAA